MTLEISDIIDLDNPEFQTAFEFLRRTNANVFLTGKAGTGKSTFLKYICNNLRKKYVVLAPTGVAAVNVGGVTIHSFFQMPLRPVPPDDADYSISSLKNSRKYSREKRKLISELELLIIDEVSMVRPDMIDFIDRTLRGVRNKRGVPFGGVQLLLVGDIFQLEPVTTTDTRDILSRYYSDFFFFNAKAYQDANLVSIELKKIYRQNDNDFINLLDRIRLNETSHEDLRLLNSRIIGKEDVLNNEPEQFGIILSSRRDTVAQINSGKMAALDTEEVLFEGEIQDDFPEKLLPTDLNLVLKEKAQVMLIRNDKDHRWVNGTLGRIKSIDGATIMVTLEDGREAKVEKETWENINYKYDENEKKVVEEIIGKFVQYPLKAAWALTIHKSQGFTFNNVIIDMGGRAFSAGQTYVALSRCRSLDGLKFMTPLSKYDIIVSRSAEIFSRNFNDSAYTEKLLKEAEALELSKAAIKNFYNGEIGLAIDCIWKVHNLTGALALNPVRKLISKYLGEINRLRHEISEKNKLLGKLALEFVDLGNICLDESENICAARLNFEKALSLNPCEKSAELGLAKCLALEKDIKGAYELLDRLIKSKGRYRYAACLIKGDIQADNGELSEASLNYQAAAKIKPKEREPILRLISLYENAGMDESADLWRDWLESM